MKDAREEGWSLSFNSHGNVEKRAKSVSGEGRGGFPKGWNTKIWFLGGSDFVQRELEGEETEKNTIRQKELGENTRGDRAESLRSRTLQGSSWTLNA